MASDTIRTLQAGRAMAALAVVLVHATNAAAAQTVGLPGWIGWIAGHGWLGVDFFFVLSGFIMAYIHRDFDGGAIGPYARSRLARVFIPYLPVGLAMAALYTLIPGSADGRGWNWLASATLLPGSGEPALNVAWTLQFELTFYAVFGLSLAAGRPFAGVAAWVGIAILYNLVVGEPPARLNPLLNPIVIEFLFGMAAAKLVGNGRLTYPLVGAAASLLLYALLGGGTAARAIFALAMAFTLVSLVRAEQRGQVNVPAPLVFLGAASYAIYLVHSPLVALGAGLSDRWWLSLAGGVAVSTAAGVAYHLGWEVPALRWIRRAGRPAVRFPLGPPRRIA